MSNLFADLALAQATQYTPNAEFNKAVLFFKDGSYLSFEHTSRENRWAKPSEDASTAGEICRALKWFRLNAKHLQLFFQDESDAEFGKDLRYPIGRFTFDPTLAEKRRPSLIDQIERAPADLRAAVAGLSEEQLDTPYRPEGWTVRQTVHHVPDSHLHSYIRFKLAITEDEPTIKPYREDLWAQLADGRTAPVEVSLALLESLHFRWVMLLRSMNPGDWERKFNHPERGIVTLDSTLGLYAWHGRHHVAHIVSLRDRMGW